MKKISTILIIFTLLLISVSGCISSNNERSDVTAVATIIDDEGYEVTLYGDITRVISTSPSETEIFYAINTPESGIELVGRTDYCTYPDEALSVPSMGGPKTLSIDAIVKADPDLVLATTVSSREVTQQLRDLGYPVILFDLKSLDDIYRNIETLGSALGLEESAASYVSSMKERVSTIEDLPPASENITVAYLVSSDPMYVAGSGTLQGELIGLAHGINVFGDKEWYYPVSDEALVSRKPDVIIMPMSHGTGSKNMKGDIIAKDVFREVPAVKSGRLYELEADMVSRPGPRIVDALEKFYECINSA